MRDFKFFQKETNDSYYLYHIREESIPLDVIECGEIGAYQQGVDTASNNLPCLNPYTDSLRAEIWNRGFWRATYRV